MVKNLGNILTVIGLLVIGIMPVVGQQTEDFAPYERLVMLRVDPERTYFPDYGDLYSWLPGESGLFRETTYGYNAEPILSPDGTKAVYLSLAQEFIEAIQVGDTFDGGPRPTNIWLMDLTTPLGDSSRFVRIADQTSGLPADDEEARWSRRSTPVWSPDGSQLAWIEPDLLRTGFTGRIVIYDTRTGETQIAARDVKLGFADGGEWGLSRPDWGSVLSNTTTNAGVYPDSEGPGWGTILDLYDTNGLVSSTAISYFNNYEDQLSDLHWVLHRDEWRLAMHYPNLGWVVLDALNKAYEQLIYAPFIQAVADGNWTGHVVWAEYPLQLEWRNAGTVIYDLPSGMPVTFTPQGSPIWLNEGGELLTIEAAQLQTLPVPNEDGFTITSAAWTPSVWMTDGEIVPIQPQVAP